MVKKLDVVVVNPYRAPVPKPCNDCPFRQEAAAGWLGGGSPESFVGCINKDEPLPCHQTIDYTNPRWKDAWEDQVSGNMCAGALIMTANVVKRPRDPAFPRLPADREAVFATFNDFVKYHRASPVKSWDEDDQSDESKFLRKLFEKNK